VSGARESGWTRWRRRAMTLPAYGVALVALGLLSPFVLPVVAGVDLCTDRRFPRTRCVLFAFVYLACEVGGLVASAALWLGRPLWPREQWLARHYALQTAWAGTLFRAASRLFGFRTEITGDDAAGAGPLLVFIRHASVADTLLPAVFLTGRQGLRLRYVLKRELLWDPCLDVVGQRLPNLFVRRDGTDTAAEVAAVRALAVRLAPTEGVLVYPEGTRFTPAKQARRLAEIAARDLGRHARVSTLRRVLPPRLGGPLALLDACPEADVLVVAHTGFEGIETFGDTWAGSLIGRRVRVALWRVPRATIPRSDDERARWLDDLWEGVDAWVVEHEART
jgi:1-acyl-sn-glycerol-3-phosphate acyltransferase